MQRALGWGTCSDLWICPLCSWAPIHCPALVLHPEPHPGLVHPVVLLEVKNGAYVSKGTRVRVLPGHLRGLIRPTSSAGTPGGATRANGAFGIDLILWNLKLQAVHVPFSPRSSAKLWVMAVPSPDSDPEAEPNPEVCWFFFFTLHLINVRFLSGSTDYLKRTISPRSNFIRIYSHLC